MKALTYEGPKTIAVSEIPDPTPDERTGAVVKITACGICGSDLHIYDGHGFSQDLGYCVGHEAVGEVVEVGSAVSRFAIGDRVLVPASTGCNSCDACRRGLVLQCATHSFGCYGLSHALEGSQAEAVGVPFADANLALIPEGVSDLGALMCTDNLPTAWYGLRRGRIEPGDVVTVVGLGPIGLLQVLGAQLLGASKVFAVDLVPERRAAAAALGAIPVEGEPIATLTEATSGRLSNVVLEAVGLDATIDLAIDLAGQGGRVSVIGVNQSIDFRMKMVIAQFKELELAIGLCSVQRELPTILPLVASGRLDPEVVITHELGLSEGVAAYDIFSTRADGVSKVVLDPSR